MDQIRQEAQATRRRVAALSMSQRQELIAQKHVAQLEHVLLPDAPPRKRRLSPVRVPYPVVYHIDQPGSSHDCLGPSQAWTSPSADRIDRPGSSQPSASKKNRLLEACKETVQEQVDLSSWENKIKEECDLEFDDDEQTVVGLEIGRQRMCVEGATRLLEACKETVQGQVHLSSWENKIKEECDLEFDDDEQTAVDHIDQPGSSHDCLGPSQAWTSPSADRIDRPGSSQPSASKKNRLLEACKETVQEQVDLSSWENKIKEECDVEFDDDEQTEVGLEIGRQRMCVEGATRLLEACKETVQEQVDLSSWENKIKEECDLEFDDDEQTEVEGGAPLASSLAPHQPDPTTSDQGKTPSPEFAIFNDTDFGAENDIGLDATTCRPSIGVADKCFDRVLTDLKNYMTDSDDEEDNVDDTVPNATERDAVTEPSHFDGMSDFQAEIVEAEDAANDRALRDMLRCDDNDMYRFDWSSDRHTLLSERETFNESTGPTFSVTDRTRSIDVFDKMFDVEFVDRLVAETNRYAVQKIGLMREQNKLSSASRYNRWTPTDRDEMYSFLAVHILQGLYPLAEEVAYFGFNGFGTLQYFPKIMSYNRFLLLKVMLHFVDNDTIKTKTKLSKIQPVIEHFNDKFSSLYMPSQEIAIDESLLKWHGRLSFAQKVRSKAEKVGVETYELCESSSGYLWKFIVYTGKDRHDGDRPDGNRPDHDRLEGDRPDHERLHNDRPDHDRLHNDRPDHDRLHNVRPDRLATDGSGVRPTNATAQIVIDLIDPLLHRGHTLIMDNFYNCPLLLRCLKKQKTDCYGTLRANREFVPKYIKTLTKPQMRTGEVVPAYCSDLAVFAMRDANIVTMISTFHKLHVGTVDKNIKTYKPTIVLDYNRHMGRIDRKDQFLSALPMERLKNRVWYKKLFRRLCNVAIFNCFVIFSSYHRKISHRQFRTTLAEDLLRRHKLIDLTTEPRLVHSRTKVTGQATTTTTLTHRTRVDSNHFPLPTGSKNTRCSFCKKCRTSWKCEECNVNLCLLICFKAHHKV